MRRVGICGGLVLLGVAWLAGCAGSAKAPTVPTTPVVLYSLNEPQRWPGDLVVPLHPAGPYRHLDVAINGQPTGRFLFDTGANRPVIDTGRANMLGLPDVGGGTTTGIAGATATRYRQASSLRLSSSLASPQPFVLDTSEARMIALNMRDLGGPNAAATSGIVCFRTLMRVPFTFNPQAGTLTLHRPGDFRPPDANDPGVTRVRLRRFHGLPAVDAALLDADGKPVAIRLILDTGMNSAMSVPIEVLADRPGVAAVPVSGAGTSRGIGGSLNSTNTWARSTKVFDLEMRNLPVSFEPMPDAIKSADGLPQGRLGMGVLGHFELTFDATRNWLYARYLGPGGDEKTAPRERAAASGR